MGPDNKSVIQAQGALDGSLCVIYWHSHAQSLCTVGWTGPLYEVFDAHEEEHPDANADDDADDGNVSDREKSYDGTSCYYGGMTTFKFGPIGNVNYPVCHLSITVVHIGHHIGMAWVERTKEFLKKTPRRWVCNVEAGDICANLHIQGISETSMPTDKQHLRKYSSLLRQAINPPAHQLKISVKNMTGGQTVEGMLGYTFN